MLIWLFLIDAEGIVGFRNFGGGKMIGLRREWAVGQIVVIMITLMFFRSVSPENHLVGGPSGWNLTPDIQRWADETTFNVGDFLVFLYNQSANDVSEVQHLDYLNCNASHPIRTYNSGKTVIKLTQPGPMYFICSRGDHCKRGLRLQIEVQPQFSYDNFNGITTTTISLSSSPATSPPSDATSAHAPYGAGEVGKSLHFGYVLVIIVLVMLVLCCPMVSF